MLRQTPNSEGDGTRDCGTFFLDVVGTFGRDGVSVRWCGQGRQSNDQLDRLIDQAWQIAIWQARRGGQVLYDGDLCRLADYKAEGNQLELTLGKVSFKEFVGTNQTQAYVRYQYGPEVLADPLGVSGALVSEDGFLLLGRRSGRVAQYGGRIHPIGGIIEPHKAAEQAPDPFQSMLDELLEETGTPAGDVREISLMGLVRDKHTVQPELIFDVFVSLEAQAILRAAKQAKDAHEHAELMPVRNHPATIVTFLQQHFAELTPVALATLLLHGLRHWGSGWFANARGYLRSVV